MLVLMMIGSVLVGELPQFRYDIPLPDGFQLKSETTYLYNDEYELLEISLDSNELVRRFPVPHSDQIIANFSYLPVRRMVVMVANLKGSSDPYRDSTVYFFTPEGSLIGSACNVNYFRQLQEVEGRLFLNKWNYQNMRYKAQPMLQEVDLLSCDQGFNMVEVGRPFFPQTGPSRQFDHSFKLVYLASWDQGPDNGFMVVDQMMPQAQIYKEVRDRSSQKLALDLEKPFRFPCRDWVEPKSAPGNDDKDYFAWTLSFSTVTGLQNWDLGTVMSYMGPSESATEDFQLHLVALGFDRELLGSKTLENAYFIGARGSDVFVAIKSLKTTESGRRKLFLRVEKLSLPDFVDEL